MTNTTPGNYNYAHLLKHPNWQRKRLEILQRDEFKCAQCNDDDTTLHVHHLDYIKGRKPWEYENDNFRSLCSICHEIEHLPKTETEEFLIRLMWIYEYRLQVPKESRIDTRDEIYKQLKERI